ncbi:hypothetical protein AAFF_G00130710 [Aldrovandia affinis]|uniref:Interleukin-12 subunit alpha n=1 Tax=Aldrovandia affinis TaxID=143900 RepID=A0AAD7W9A6_9TELE|nr:hypothetical protein AAFF_G00130710 [Aldrovandia affinis]
MLANVKIPLVSWLFFAAISQHLCPITVGIPLNTVDKVDTTECAALSRALLSEVNTALNDTPFYGFNCITTDLLMEVKTSLSACELNTEQEERCAESQNTKFNQNECLRNIKADLEYYRDHLSSSTVVKAIRDLLKSLNFPSPTKPSSTVTLSNMNEFDTRRDLCKQLKGFRVRTITINRIMGYMAAGGHKD